jgi:hypothetical protein
MANEESTIKETTLVEIGLIGMCPATSTVLDIALFTWERLFVNGRYEEQA